MVVNIAKILAETDDPRFHVDASLFGQGDKIAKFHHATSSEMMNLSALVWKNGSTSHYMRNELSFSTTLPEIIWHIGTYVKHLEAWEKGNAVPQRGVGSRLYGGVLFLLIMQFVGLYLELHF